MSNKQIDIVERVSSFLEQNTRGNQIGIYTVAGLGLAFAIHKVRPLSKFSRAVDVPKHFIKQREPLRGRIVDCESTIHGTRLLFDHRPLVRIPIWHSNKPPLPVQVWGVQLVGANGQSWLQCVAVGREVTVTPISKNENSLVGHVTIHWPIKQMSENQSTTANKVDKKSKKKTKKVSTVEDIDVAQNLIELGMAKMTEDVPQPIKRNIFYYWWTPWIKEPIGQNRGYILQRAQDKAKATRSGFWEGIIKPSPFETVYHLFKPYLPKLKKSKVSIA